MLLLALDTTGRSGGLALVRDDQVLEVLRLEAPRGFGDTIFTEIQAILARHHCSLREVDVYAAAAGPGSFTGIRVGLTAVKALAEAHGKGVVPVSTLLALAAGGEGRYRAPVMDARRGEVFAAVYDNHLRVAVPEVVTPWPEFLRLAGGRQVTFVSHVAGLFDSSGIAPLDGNEQAGRRYLTVSEPLAALVARVAADRAASGRIQPPEEVDANYIRRSDAELNWKDPSGNN